MRLCHTVLALFLAIPAFSQNTPQKIGHADWEFIFSQMPEYKQIQTDLKTYETQLQNQLQLKSKEFEDKYKTFMALPADTPEAIKRDKQTELAYLEENIQKFREDAQASIQKKQNDLVSPVFAKVGKAIEDVAVENGYAYIMNPHMFGGGDVLLYANEKYDVSELVLKKLGVVLTK